MKKTITAIIAAAMLAIPAASSAQALIDTGTPSKVVQAGIRVGFNTSNLTTNYDEAFPEIAWNHTQWKQGFTIGAAVDINLKITLPFSPASISSRATVISITC